MTARSLTPMRPTLADLPRLGFPATATGLRNYQAAWNLGSALTIDGILGPLTRAALVTSLTRHTTGRGTISDHFSAREFACKCDGKYQDCARVAVTRWQLRALEQLRTAAGRPLPIVSGYRCTQHNRAVGGAPNSQHRNGSACDVPPMLTLAQVRALGVFSGIGYQSRTGLVVHVDTRHAAPSKNTTSGTTARPTVWSYQ